MTAFDILSDHGQELLAGLLVTLELCLFIWSTGIILGTTVGIAGARWRVPVGLPSRLISFLLSGLPVLVLLFWLHYPMQSLMVIVIDPFFTAAATLSIASLLYAAEIVDSSI